MIHVDPEKAVCGIQYCQEHPLARITKRQNGMGVYLQIQDIAPCRKFLGWRVMLYAPHHCGKFT